ncbi:deoxyribodipyrimidine photo-lyase [Shewanella halotolerans]|uniref:deoxyribodipyrimidine photo-lyase n=1 Tax=Shewanella halotolerans TaxID=2864204 RepID=UPI001C6610C9|nr:deoxyribodipyrimidine photo-lyase [Shewanella halotolerans]QYJ88625.1 deoxyribodipyrimidine photo-lyase [Shewanella halotolerans]
MSALLWLRRDFRLHDNPALSEAVRLGVKQAIFIATPTQWQQHDMAPIKADLIRRHLELMAGELSQYGIELVILSATDFSDQVRALCDYCREHSVNLLLANSEPELDEQERDKQVMTAGIDLRLWQNDTILPPGSVLNQQGEMFKVFTPFKKAWLKCVAAKGIECVPTPAKSTPAKSIGDAQAASQLPQQPTLQSSSINLDYPLVDSSRWPDSEQVMSQLLPHFWQDKLLNYGERRDFPAIKGTSGLSPYLAIGAISSRWLALQLVQRHPEVIYDIQHGAFTWLNELIWRDFYKHLLFHYPELIKGRSFQPKYESLPWPNNEDHFQAWCEGRTGYPIVDAAMKQLRRTGWMHNRLRMIVASFLTKHLLVDWHKGERFFMQQLIDGDFSANNGGWQWAASTGCDAQPYFRIFNPITQSQKFDPRGDFIRKYLPELSEVPDKQIHFPHDYLASQGKAEIYPAPIVDHKAARQRALAFYKVE